MFAPVSREVVACGESRVHRDLEELLAVVGKQRESHRLVDDRVADLYSGEARRRPAAVEYVDESVLANDHTVSSESVGVAVDRYLGAGSRREIVLPHLVEAHRPIVVAVEQRKVSSNLLWASSTRWAVRSSAAVIL